MLRSSSIAMSSAQNAAGASPVAGTGPRQVRLAASK
jgi:hypothetical protein